MGAFANHRRPAPASTIKIIASETSERCRNEASPLPCLIAALEPGVYSFAVLDVTSAVKLGRIPVLAVTSGRCRPVPARSI